MELIFGTVLVSYMRDIVSTDAFYTKHNLLIAQAQKPVRPPAFGKNGLPYLGSRCRLGVEITQGSQRLMARIANDDVVENFDFQKLTRSNEVTGDFDVGFGRGCFTARMIVRDDDGGGTRHDG